MVALSIEIRSVAKAVQHQSLVERDSTRLQGSYGEGLFRENASDSEQHFFSASSQAALSDKEQVAEVCKTFVHDGILNDESLETSRHPYRVISNL